MSSSGRAVWIGVDAGPPSIQVYDLELATETVTMPGRRWGPRPCRFRKRNQFSKRGPGRFPFQRRSTASLRKRRRQAPPGGLRNHKQTPSVQKQTPLRASLPTPSDYLCERYHQRFRMRCPQKQPVIQRSGMDIAVQATDIVRVEARPRCPARLVDIAAMPARDSIAADNRHAVAYVRLRSGSIARLHRFPCPSWVPAACRPSHCARPSRSPGPS